VFKGQLTGVVNQDSVADGNKTEKYVNLILKRQIHNDEKGLSIWFRKYFEFSENTRSTLYF